MTKRLGAILFFAWITCSAAAIAGEIEEVKQRMEQRLPKISQMKKEQAVGENNRGYLEVLKENRADKAVVRAENKDRKLVYKAIAKETDSDTTAVGRQRARQIAERSAPGIMLQDTKGRWKAKAAGK